MLRHAFSAVLVVMATACISVFTPGSPPCEFDQDCSDELLGSDFQGYVCHDERCIPEADRPADAGPPPDAGRPEAGAPDSGFDAGDVGVGDAGPSDIGPTDVPPASEDLYGIGACSNGEDDDNDGQTDCDDDDCSPLAFCADEICDNDFDDNADGLIDCNDPDCSNDIACQPRVTICDIYEDNVLAGCETCHQHRFDGNEFVEEAAGGYEVTHSSAFELHESLFRNGSSGRAAVVSGVPEASYLLAKLAGTHTQAIPACAEDDQACIEGRGARMPMDDEPLTDGAIESIRRWIGSGDTRRCLDGYPVENCEDGRDNDGDGRADCDDRDCRQALVCQGGATICQLFEANVFASCNGCHVQSASGGLRFDTSSAQALYDSLMQARGNSGLPLVRHNDLSASYLYLKLSGEQQSIQGGGGQRMPTNGAALDEEALTMIRAWIGSDDLAACLGD